MDQTSTVSSGATQLTPGEVRDRLAAIRDRLAKHTLQHPGGAHAQIADQTVEELGGLINELDAIQRAREAVLYQSGPAPDDKAKIDALLAQGEAEDATDTPPSSAA